MPKERAEKSSERPLAGPGEPREDERRDMLPREIGGRRGPEPTRYGDWEKSGRCIDF